MVGIIANLWLSFVAGLLAPLGAVCVLPLYPGFLAYLSHQLSGKESRNTIALFGIIAMLGVFVSMFIIGFIFAAVFQASLACAIRIISPLAFAVLALISILLLLNVNVGKFLPQLRAPAFKNPYFSSFMFGLFFGAIVIPCNPAPLIVLFALSTSAANFLSNFLNFLFFGIGMGLPLLALSFISAAKSTYVLDFLTRHQRIINFIAGIIMLAVSLYYLLFVFRVQQYLGG